jgi:murein DD-endopeptidase MepM/ murein hydrolase activator NlpD
MKGQKTSLNRKYKKYALFAAGTLMAGVLAFFITINVYKVDEVEKKPYDISNNNDSKTVTGIPEKTKLITDESSVRTMPLEQIANKDNNLIEKKSSNSGKTGVSEKKNTEIKSSTVKKTNSFMLPVEGTIGMDYSISKLVFSNTLQEWITHTGVDIKTEELKPVKAVESGIIKDIKMDPRYGVTIIIEHEDGFKSSYSNLSTIDLVKINQQVKKGDIISGVGAGYGFETEDGPHIHFELLKDDKIIDPHLYIKFM